jgi:hypothetical protein
MSETIKVDIQHGPGGNRHGDFAAKAGIGLGTALAVSISWSLHKSILWAILHGILSWFYVAYYALTR